MIAASENGSMTKEILTKYLEKVLEIYPDAHDELGFRVLMKTDSGSGRKNKDFIATAKALGIDVYPGLPNSSEGTQEMGQLFALFKSLMEKNRRFIFQEKQKRDEGDVTFEDLAEIIFGGKYYFKDGTSVDMPYNAFERAFTPDHLKSAREKCGYCECTRKALLNPRCRREFGDDVDESLFNGCPADNDELLMHISNIENSILRCGEGSDTTSYDELLLTIEELNHKAVHDLYNLGFHKAKILKTSVKRNDSQIESNRRNTTTQPGTRERQLRLEQAKSVGQFFQFTEGGDAKTCDDMLIALERMDMRKKAKSMGKERAIALKRREVVSRVNDIMANGGPRLKDDYKDLVEWETMKKSKSKDRRTEDCVATHRKFTHPC